MRTVTLSETSAPGGEGSRGDERVEVVENEKGRASSARASAAGRLSTAGTAPRDLRGHLLSAPKIVSADEEPKFGEDMMIRVKEEGGLCPSSWKRFHGAVAA